MNYEFNYDPQNKTLQFITHQNLFSPTNPDKGTLAMLEVVYIEEDDKVLDLGCGYGFVGIVLKSFNPSVKIDMIDKDPLAIQYANKNIIKNKVNARAWVSNGFNEVKDYDYTKILSNPPYHADFSVAKGFIEEGFKRLLIGGQMILVVKRLLWYKNKLSSIFGGIKINKKDDYYVLVSEKRSIEPPKEAKKPIKKKHLKRLTRTKRRKKRKLK